MVQKRQAILVGLMVLVLLYGAFDYFRGGGASAPSVAPDAASARADAARTVDMVNQMLAKSPMTEVDFYRAQVLRRGLNGSPFYASDAEFYFPGAAAANDSGLRYKGFVRVGNKVLAVINDVEYAVGEEIEASGYVVASIQPSYVEVTRTDSSGRSQSRRLPLAEDPHQPVDIKVDR